MNKARAVRPATEHPIPLRFEPLLEMSTVLVEIYLGSEKKVDMLLADVLFLWAPPSMEHNLNNKNQNPSQ